MISSDLSRREDNSTSSWDIASPRITPPGTPPPPYGNTSGEITLHGTDFNGIGHVSLWLLAKKFTLDLINFNFFFQLDASYSGPIISMEDDDMSDQEMVS